MAKNPFGVEEVSATRAKPTLEGTSAEDAAASSGVLGSPKLESTVDVARGPNSKVVGKYLNSSIAILSSGSAPNSDQIFITAGHGAALKNITAIDPETGEDIPYVGNNFYSDASQIILGTSMNLASAEIAEGSVTDPGDQANIYIGTDYLTLDGTKSIKLVTGRKSTTSTGGDSKMSYGGVEIIAGNDDTDLQPMVKGLNLIFAFAELRDRVQLLSDTVHAFAQQQNKFNTVLKSHTHPDLLSMALFGMSPNKNVLKNQKVKSVGSKTCSMITENTLPDCEAHRTDLDRWQAKYLGGTEKDSFILSDLNKVN